MATKISLSHARFLVSEKDHHKLLDVYLSLARLSSEVKTETGKKFIIHSPSGSRYKLSQTLLNMIPSVKSLTTVYTALKVLSDNGLFTYNKQMMGWEIIGMEDMFTEGYMELREIFFTPIFQSLSYLEKKTLFYMIYVMSLKKFKSFKKIKVNILDPESELRKIYKTENVYYIRKQVKSVVEKFFVTVDDFVSDMSGLSKSSQNRANRRHLFKLSLKPKQFINSSIARPTIPITERIRAFRDIDSSFYSYLSKLPDYMEWTKDYLSDDIKLQLLRQCATLYPRDKQEITLRILSQIRKGTLIKSIGKYIEKTIKTYLEENYILS